MRSRPDYAYGTADKVLREAEASRSQSAKDGEVIWQPKIVSPTPQVGSPVRLIKSITARDLLAKSIEPPEMLVEDLWSVEGCGYFAGEPKTFKTHSIIEVALAIQAKGKVFGRFQVLRSGPVLIFLEETKPGEAQQRLLRHMSGAGIDPSQVGDIHFVIQQRIKLDRESDQEQIRHLCELYRPILTFFDPLVRMRDGSENQPELMNPVLSFLRELQIEYHTGVVVTHHLAKPDKDRGSNIRTAHRIRGTGDQHAWYDNALFFTRVRDNDRVQVEVEHREAPSPNPFTIGLRSEGESVDSSLGFDCEMGELLAQNVQDASREILAALEENPNGLKVTEIHKIVSIRKDDVQSAIKHLASTERITTKKEKRQDTNGVNRPCKICYLPEHAPHEAKDQ